VGLLMNAAADNPEAQPRLSAFREGLQQLGWTDGSNVRIDIRWGANDVELDRRYATELISLAPDLVVAAGTLSVAALQRVTRTVPILFCNVADPVGAGFVDSLARPGGNTTWVAAMPIPMPRAALGSQRSGKACRNWDGSKDAIFAPT